MPRMAGRQQELGPRCRRSDALTAHKNQPGSQWTGGQHLWCLRLATPPFGGLTPNPVLSPSLSFHDLDANSHDRRHQPHTLSAAAQERTPAVGGRRGLGGAAAWQQALKCGSSCPPSLAAAADSDPSTAMLTHNG